MTPTPNAAQLLVENPPAAVSFDLFGTLVQVERTTHPAELIATELRRQDISVPANWYDVYHEPRGDMSAETEQSLVSHVEALLTRDDVEPDISVPHELIEQAVLAAFETPVETPESAQSVVETLAGEVPIGILSNCSVPGLVEQVLAQSALDPTLFDAIVASVNCGWRKPSSRAFKEVANGLAVEPSQLLHVGDSPEADGGITDIDGHALIIDNPKDLTEVTATQWW